MARVQFGLSSYERGRGDLPDLPVINMFAEEAPTEEGNIVLQSRPGLADREQDMAASISGVFRGDGVLAGQLFGVADGALYDRTTVLGTVGYGPVSWGGFSDRVFVTAGESLWQYDGAAMAQVAMPDGQDVAAIVVGSSRVLAIAKNTQQFYWSDSLTSTVDGLSFANAENSPDRLRDILYIDDTAVLFGAETVEFWPNTGNEDLPFTPLEGRVIERGIRNTGACCHIGPSFAWVTNENQVCVQTEDNVISSTGLQAKIEASDACSLFRFTMEGNEFLALRLDTETHVYSRRSGLWSRFETYGQTNWTATCWADGVFGGTTGATLEWGSDHADAVALDGVMERRFRAGQPINSAGVVIGNVGLRTNPGNTPFLTGDYLNPVVGMRQSRDGGRTWGSWRNRSLGEQGDYRRHVQWRACGMASRPSWLAEFRVTDPVPFRVSGVLVNEPFGGR